MPKNAVLQKSIRMTLKIIFRIREYGKCNFKHPLSLGMIFECSRYYAPFQSYPFTFAIQQAISLVIRFSFPFPVISMHNVVFPCHKFSFAVTLLCDAFSMSKPFNHQQIGSIASLGRVQRSTSRIMLARR